MRTDETIAYFGDQTALAKAIGITPAAVSQWGKEVPMSRRASVRMAMRERADNLEREAKRIRKASKDLEQ
jgi:DNA-binding transcriptional regulator YdaS (Cro superfamily)